MDAVVVEDLRKSYGATRAVACWMLASIAATVNSAFAAIIVGVRRLDTRPTLAFGEEYLRMHIVQLCPHADQMPTCITRLRAPRLASALRGPLMEVPWSGAVVQGSLCRGLVAPEPGEVSSGRCAHETPGRRPWTLSS